MGKKKQLGHFLGGEVTTYVYNMCDGYESIHIVVSENKHYFVYVDYYLILKDGKSEVKHPNDNGEIFNYLKNIIIS